MKEIKKMKVVELRAELKRRGLPTDGLKAVLAARLQDDEDQKQQQQPAAAVEEPAAAEEAPVEDMQVDPEEVEEEEGPTSEAAPEPGPGPGPEEEAAPAAEPAEAAKPEEAPVPAPAQPPAPAPPAPPAEEAEEAEEDNADKMDVSDDDDDDDDDANGKKPVSNNGKAEQEKPPAPAEDAKAEQENPAAAATAATAASAAPLPLPPPPPPPPPPAAAAAAPAPPSTATGIQLTPAISSLLHAATAHLETRRVHLTELESSLLLSTTLLRHPEGLSSAQATKLPGAVRDAWHALGDGCRPMGREAAASGDDLGVLGIDAAAAAGASATATAAASAAAGSGGGGEEGGGAKPNGEGMEVVVTPGQLGVASRAAALSTALHRAVEVARQLAQTTNGSAASAGGKGGDGQGGQQVQVQVVQDVRDMLRQIDDAAREAEEAAPDGGGGGDAKIIGNTTNATNTTKGSTDVLLEAFYARLSEVREYHAKHEVTEDAVMAAVAGGGAPAAATPADDAAMDIDEPSRQKILALTQGSKRRKIRHGNPQADGYDLHSLLLTEMSKVRGGDLYSPQEVFGRYLDLTDVHDGLAAGVGGGSSSGSATLRTELSKVAAAASATASTGSATSTPAASSADMEEEKKDDDGASASVAFPYVDFLSLLTQPLGTLLPETTKLNNRKPYVRFLSALYDYLLGFLRRTMPLLDVEGEVIQPALKEFELTWGETGGYPGWESRMAEKVLASTSSRDNNAESSMSSSSATSTGTNIDLASYTGPQELCDAIDADTLKAELSRIGLKCGGAPLDRAKRLFLLKDTALSDLPKKVWAKGRGPPPPTAAADGGKKPEGASDESDGLTKASVSSASSALTSSSLAGSSRRIDVARLEVATQSLLDQLRPTLDATVRRAERQLYQTSNERENELDEEINGIAGVRGKKPKDGKDRGDGEDGDSDDDSDEEDAPIYNPKGVPLGWDGKPIPYWLFKLHGLNHFYSCEICGNESYRGRHNFEKHFQESKHVYGMRCLGIPNTRHFHGVTKIEDAQHLWAKLQQTVEGNVFDGEKEEEYEDSHGNVLTRKTYEDLSRQGLL